MPRAKKSEDQPWLKYIVLPLLLIFFGLESSYLYLSRTKTSQPSMPVVITATPTPTPTPQAKPDLASPDTSDICGGIANLKCLTGYKCVLDAKYPDASGKCISSGKYACPKTPWVDCMPGPGPVKSQCTSSYLSWAAKNCPGFQGGAY